MEQLFDAVIIGAGQAGPSLAGRLAGAGWSVAFVEKDLLGGTCVNRGCTPTKAMVASAKTAYTAAQGSAYGLIGGESVRVDLRKVKARKDAIVAKSKSGLESWMGGMSGCTLFDGSARLDGPGRVQVGEDLLSSQHIFLNVGARPRVPEMPGIKKVPYLTSTTILEIETRPRHLIVVGGSYVGLEFAQIFRRFGSEVTVVERGPTLLSHADLDVRESVRQILEAEGIRFRLHAECIRLESGLDGVVVHIDFKDGSPALHGSHVLLAVGRQPNTDDLGLESVGLSTNEQGYIEVDDQLRTAVGGVWALGDCNGRGGFTHTSYNDIEIVAANLLDHGSRLVSDRIPVHALYIDPPLAHVGMSEREVRERGKPALMGVRPMTKVSRAVEKGETEGFMKVLVDEAGQQILGATILGVGGDEAIHCILTAMYAKQPAALLQRSVHIHPTVAELIPTVFQDLRRIKA